MNNVRLGQPPAPTYGYQYGPGVFNTQMAQAQSAGDPRWQAKQLDRAGMSRGKAQQKAAAERGAGAMAEGIASAYGQQVSDASALSGMALQAQANQEQFAQALADMQMQQRAGRMGLLQGLL